jgi:hypothetical protein
VQVNVKGRRFSNETLGHSEQAAAVLARPERCAFTVFHERVASIPDLYAAGGAACWVSGASTWGYLSGNARWPQYRSAARPDALPFSDISEWDR